MNEKCIIMFHQGWTDIILCIGLVFYNKNLYKNIELVIREDSKELIEFIFKDYDCIKLNFIDKKLLDNFFYRNSLFLNYKNNNYDVNIYGGININHPKNYVIGDKYYFYKAYNINENLSINNFIIKRNYKIEEEKYNDIIKNIGDNYVIIFDDKSRNLCINFDKIVNKNLPRFNLCNSSKICFDMIKIIENSKELHILSTFWSLIIYQLQKKYDFFKNLSIYFHDSVRPGYYKTLYENNNWIIV